jgi:DNA-binding beta-propeller fold protein YncE
VCPEYSHVTLVAGLPVDTTHAWPVFGFGGDGGPATAATLNIPLGLALDAEGNLLIADTYNSRIRMVNATTGIIDTVAVTPGTFLPQDVAVDRDGTIYYSALANDCFYISKTGSVYKRDVLGNVSEVVSGLPCPLGIALHPETNDLYIAAYGNSLDPHGAVYWLQAGTQTLSAVGLGALFTNPMGVVFWGGQLHVSGQPWVLRRDPQGTTTVLAYSACHTKPNCVGILGFNGQALPEGLQAITDDTAVVFADPFGIALDAQGSLLLASGSASRVFKVQANTGNVSVVLGYGQDRQWWPDSLYPNDPPRTQIENPRGMAVAPDGSVYVAVDSRVLKLWC